jgi:hypothetical protein
VQSERMLVTRRAPRRLGWRGVRASSAKPHHARGIVVDGFKGVQLELSVPADIDFSTCDDGDFDSWTAVSGSWNGSRFQQGPGQVDRLWILGIDGERLVVDAAFMPSADAKDREELWQVMESIRFQT